MQKESLARLIRQEGIVAVTKAISSPAHTIRRALGDGWDVRGWEATEGTGAILFARYAEPPPPDNPEVITLRAEQRDLARIERETQAASYHDGTVRRQRDAARNRINEIDYRLLEIDAESSAHLEGLAPTRAPVEAVICLNTSWSAEIEATVAEAGYPTIILWRSDWLPQSGIPVQSEEVPF